MALVIPSSVVTLYSGIRITDGEQIVFSSKEEQSAYFLAHRVTNKAACSYVRKTGSIRIEWPTVQVNTCNYLSFVNPAFENMTIYARISDWRYINNVTTEIDYNIDWFQTYMFDAHYENGHIVREHLSQTDFETAEENPFDPGIYEFQTGENFPLTTDMMESNPLANTYPLMGSDNSVVVIQLALIDVDQLPTWNTFVDLFDNFIEDYGPVAKGYVMLAMYTPYGDRLNTALNYLTAQSLTGQVIGIYQMNRIMWDNYMGLIDTPSFAVVPLEYECVNKKLRMFPYQFLRVYNNEGDCKEYKYENFTDIQTGQYGKLKYLPLFDGVPMTTLLPENYMIQGYNMNERMDIHQIPQVGYCTDAYLSFVSSQYQMNVASRTRYSEFNTQRDYYGAPVQAGLSAFSLSPKGVSMSYADTAKAAASVYGQDTMDATEAMILYKEASAARGISAQGANKLATGDYPGITFNNAKPAFVADDYHAGSSNGTLSYYSGAETGPGVYTICHVRLKESILKVYDEYLSAYGYSSGRYGIPRLCNYITGEGEQPHFQDGQTYVMTQGMHVTGVPQYVSDDIEALFNKGCHFLKGSDLS